VFKRFAIEMLLDAVHAVVEGNVWMPPALQARLAGATMPARSACKARSTRSRTPSLQYVAQVRLYGLFADEQPARDVAVPESHRDVPHDVELARGEASLFGLSCAPTQGNASTICWAVQTAVGCAVTLT
jgi:hypothetical protein